MLNLRPHHILDIVQDIGNGHLMEPHPYGHLVHEITRRILDNPNVICRFVVACDDICGPCIHLVDGVCDDVLGQLEEKPSKQEYNDQLDRRLLERLGLDCSKKWTILEYLTLVEQNFDAIAAMCVHPKEDAAEKGEGLKKGIAILRKKANS